MADEISSKYLFTLFKVALLPKKYFQPEVLMALLGFDNISVLFENLNWLSKKRLLIKRNKKFSRKVSYFYEKYDFSTLETQVYVYTQFLTEKLDIDNPNDIKYRETFSEIAQNLLIKYRKYSSAQFVELNRELVRYLIRTGDIENAPIFDVHAEDFLLPLLDSEYSYFRYCPARADMLRYDAKFKKSLQLLEDNEKYISDCEDISFIVKYYLLFFSLLRYNARQNEAEELYLRALHKIQSLDAEQFYRDRLLTGLASIYLDINQTEKAINLLIELIDRQLKYLYKLHFYVADSYLLLGLAYNFIGKSELSIEYNLTALEILEYNYEGSSQEKASINYQLASAYLAGQNYGLARERLDTAIKFAEECIPDWHPDHAFYHSLNILISSWHYENPERAMLDYFETIKQYYPPQHTVIGYFHNNLAMLYAEEKKYEKSIEHLMEAYQINYNQYKKDTINQAFMLSNIALNYEALERYEDALSLLRKAEKILLVKLGKKHQDMAKIYESYAAIYAKMEKYDISSVFLDKAIETIQFYSSEHPSLVHLYFKLAENLLHLNDSKKSINIANKALDLYEAFYTKDNFLKIRILNLLAENFFLSKATKKSADYAVLAYEAFVAIWSEFLIDDDLLASSIMTYNNLFNSGKHEEASVVADKIDETIRFINIMGLTLNPRILAEAYRSVAKDSLIHGNSNRGIQLLIRALGILNKFGSVTPDYKAQFYTSLVDMFLSSHFRRLEAIPYIKWLIEYESEKLDMSNKKRIIEYYRSMASLYLTSGKYQLALAKLESAMTVFEASKLPSDFKSNIYFEMGNVYLRQGMYNHTIDLQLRALNSLYLNSDKKSEQEAFLLMQISKTYFEMTNYNMAIRYAKSAEQKYESYSAPAYTLNSIYVLLQNYYEDIGVKNEAQNYLFKIKKLIGGKLPQFSFLDYRYRLIYAKSIANKGKIDEAIQICIDLAKEMENGMMVQDFYYELVNLVVELTEKKTLT